MLNRVKHWREGVESLTVGIWVVQIFQILIKFRVLFFMDRPLAVQFLLAHFVSFFFLLLLLVIKSFDFVCNQILLFTWALLTRHVLQGWRFFWDLWRRIFTTLERLFDSFHCFKNYLIWPLLDFTRRRFLHGLFTPTCRRLLFFFLLARRPFYLVDDHLASTRLQLVLVDQFGYWSHVAKVKVHRRGLFRFLLRQVWAILWTRGLTIVFSFD